MTQAITPADISHNNLLMVAAGGLVSGIATTWLPALVDNLVGSNGRFPLVQFRLALIALPFAVLVFILGRCFSRNAWWAALLAAIITMIAFVCAVDAAILVEGNTGDAPRAMRYLLGGLTGGLVGTAVMAFGIALLPAGPRQVAAWWPMLITGALLGTLLALDDALGLDKIAFLYPLWQAGVAVRLVMVLRR
ncbi:hypothetical protein [Bradyrhizobium sp. BWA-3-5]|uniref:hypothetical protein n=1 Tax=Bradyrhizobium sp. BWA-3-5 TaxID=3080013 RepID=UPI00293E8F33|nr:hypothetical protein [Bradyrhizobium sp. BWA-3-5]WOH66832.1 hypothetical protein RX331_03330 [Bradyrhizobium sp. BWA-3-5]